MTRTLRNLLVVLFAGAAAMAGVGLAWWALLRWDGLARMAAAPPVLAGAAGLLAVLFLFAVLLSGSRREPERDRGGAPALRDKGPRPETGAYPVEPPHRRKHVFRLEVPSARADYPFLFSAVVCWRGPAPSGGAAEAAAVLAIAARAEDLAASEQPDAHANARYRLAAALGPLPVRDPGVTEAWAEEVRLEIGEEDAERLDHLRELRKLKAAREKERDIERLERDYLGGDVLADPGRAVVWWLSRNPDRVDEAVARIGTLTTLSAAATGRGPAEVQQTFTFPSAPRGPVDGGHGQDLAASAPGAHGQTPSDQDAFDAPSALDTPFPADLLAPTPFHPRPPGRTGDHDLWLDAASEAASDWEDEEEFEGFLERFAVFLKSNGYVETAALLRKEHGLGAGFASFFGSASDLADDTLVRTDENAEDAEDTEDEAADRHGALFSEPFADGLPAAGEDDDLIEGFLGSPGDPDAHEPDAGTADDTARFGTDERSSAGDLADGARYTDRY